ncbi:MAG: UDP-N-acetylmuramoyl-L-alanyl-D-glutamate--2,6-diaminopimelate ligase [Flavobacteriaceae bacterium]|nr:UDP-N-acetylmuramoyl-L-alanyl-D-glutamate--2,6-diaminopimelate ligase [Flavobacteriaceae bacterium]
MKLLKDILYKVNINSVIGSTNIKINKIEFDSREILDNDLFVAIRGNNIDGNQFIPRAIEKGAKVVLCQKIPKEIVKGVTYVKVKDIRETLALVCSNYYNNPSKKIKLIGITGTNGKTTTSNLMFQLFKLFNYKVGLISTNKIIIGNKKIESKHTTPDPLTLNKVLNKMIESKVEFCFMEVSSHAIKQKRVSGLNFKAGVFTNLSHDHLDYHKTFNEYRDIKKKFFDSLDSNSLAIVNVDDKNGNYMVQNCRARIYKYALKSNADYSLKIFEKDFNGMKISINGLEVWTRLIGNFNAYNILATYSLAKNFDFIEEEILNNISLLQTVEGRFEKITENKSNKIGIIDYAHSPDSIQNILQTLNDLKHKSSLITVLGCGGDRDTEKRPLMGKIAASLSDRVVFTSDNPRFEDPKLIIEQMQAGVNKKDLYKVSSIIDRKKAIKYACEINSGNDVILVAGKGHEKYQINGENKIDFDDKKILEKFLKNKN